jgi:HPt (histidine-containing phosphotransfer) domain-containing protein
MARLPATDQQALDQLHQLELERPGLMNELIRLFVADAPKQMRLISSSYARRDPEGLRQSAHFLRSGALALGLAWLAEEAKRVELLALDAYGSAEADRLVLVLRAELHAVLLVLLRELRNT